MSLCSFEELTSACEQAVPFLVQEVVTVLS
jgi:hypothetical protein